MPQNKKYVEKVTRSNIPENSDSKHISDHLPLFCLYTCNLHFMSVYRIYTLYLGQQYKYRPESGPGDVAWYNSWNTLPITFHKQQCSDWNKHSHLTPTVWNLDPLIPLLTPYPQLAELLAFTPILLNWTLALYFMLCFISYNLPLHTYILTHIFPDSDLISGILSIKFYN